MGINETYQEDLRILGTKLKSIRTQRGLTLKELGYRINKDPQSISRVELGVVNPTYVYLLQMCQGLEIDVSELFKTQTDKL